MKELREWIKTIEMFEELLKQELGFYLDDLHAFVCMMFIEHQFGIFKKRVVWQEDEAL